MTFHNAARLALFFALFALACCRFITPGLYLKAGQASFSAVKVVASIHSNSQLLRERSQLAAGSSQAMPTASQPDSKQKSSAPSSPPLLAPFPVRQGTKSMPYLVKPGQSVTSIAWHFLSQTVYMRRTSLENAIRQANGLKSDRLKPGQSIQIPGIPIQPVLDKPTTVPRTFQARAIYLTGWTAGSARGLDLIRKWKAVGGNAVVFDIKDYDGDVRVPYDHQYASHAGITIHNLPKYIHWLHAQNMHVIARIALFRDAHLAQAYPEMDIRSRKTGKPWLENGKLAWVDPSLPVVQDYELDLAKMVANDGADEIQFDYVRFPAEGDQPDAEFAFQKDHPDWPRTKIITDFVARAYQELHPMGVLVSLDVFGVMAWARPVDLNHTGQNITQLARHCDVISPMIYPSHFFRFDGYSDPGDAPEHFISESMRRFGVATQGSGVVLRPWLQGFHWRTKTYSVEYVLTEIRVAAEQGGIGFLFWNAINDYPKPMDAMLAMRAAGDLGYQGRTATKASPRGGAAGKELPTALPNAAKAASPQAK